MKESLFLLQDEFTPMKRRPKEDSAVWRKAGISGSMKHRDRSPFLYEAHESRLVLAQYVKHRNEATKLLQNAKYNCTATLVLCAEQQHNKYYAWIQAKGSLKEWIGAPTAGGNSALVNASRKTKAPDDFFSSVHKLEIELDRGSDIPQQPFHIENFRW